jgi:hypothetical protein
MSLIIAPYHVERDELANVVTPDPTDTHHPIAHALLADQVESALTGAGFEIIAQQHGLDALGDGGNGWKKAQRYFGGWEVTRDDLPSNDRRLVVGARNAHDKTFAASFCIGNHMLVCANLCFSSDEKIARKHTINILRDLPSRVEFCVSRITSQFHQMEVRIERYREQEVNIDRAARAVIELHKAKVLPQKLMLGTYDEFIAPRHPEFKERNLWSLYNATTEILKDTPNQLALTQRTMRLQSMFDQVAGLTFEEKVAAPEVEIEIVE